ncbi:hypothetical protein SODALDRAFT_99002 [Sodiomyces alkalinus F11]|uniref:Reticulon-like protein n=1 Tax=Sodiomyces alkalinus (strain CBS 110278 / VKM F-3762 / F11) TaxID=1314773 RepID=A0A3N2Q1B4_SODAK|nr:hypothetical protein SODALDRAFT_99002 [Sodiomyces alkalinus F11]ROT40553.1 hypothetical protein SODALDRAFT_99002 [Sodiomyces alkalinus F11]
MSDFPDAPNTAPAGNGSYAQATKDKAAATYDSLSNGPMAQNFQDESAKASNEINNLVASRKTPEYRAATGQPLTHYHSFFSELLSWKNPRASAIAYVSIVSAIVAARYLDLLRYGFKLTWMALATTVAAELTGKVLLNNGLTSQLRPRSYYTLSKETLDAAIGDVHELVNFFVIEAQRILFAENVGASAAACVGAFLSYHLVKIMPLWGLALTAVTALFLVPLVYTSNQELIDNQLKNASHVISEQTQQFRSIASQQTAHATDLTKQYMGDYSAKAQELLGRRSASPEAVPKPAPAQSTADVEEVDFPAPPTEEPKVNEAKLETTVFTEPGATEKEPLLA